MLKKVIIGILIFISLLIFTGFMITGHLYLPAKTKPGISQYPELTMTDPKYIAKAQADHQWAINNMVLYCRMTPDGKSYRPAIIKYIRRFVASGGNINSKDQYGVLPITSAAEAGKISCIIALLQEGADINLIDNNGNNAILAACKKGVGRTSVSSLIKRLLDAGADPTIADKDGKLPYDYLVEQDRLRFLYPADQKCIMPKSE